jgi:hypothetical protein
MIMCQYLISVLGTVGQDIFVWRLRVAFACGVCVCGWIFACRICDGSKVCVCGVV